MTTRLRYPIRVQAIRARKQTERLYVNIPLALAAAMGLLAGEQVEWELLDRTELHLVRLAVPPTRSRHPSGASRESTKTNPTAAPR